jgi:hypothetical protein
MDHQAIIKHIYDAFNKRDIDAVFTFFHPDVIWPNGWEGGYVHGHNEVRGYWTRQWQEINPIVTPVDVKQINESTIVVDVNQLVKNLNGGELANNVVKHTYTFKDGLVAKMDIG